ncbi:MAG: DMT family transporter [Candidatus Bathyarchaeota archaeon]|nr:DMT family transporter [Candidatus Bathyarchaeota archaeon]
MIGEISALFAAICWAVAAVLYKKALRNTNILVANLVRTVFAALLLLVIFSATQGQSSTITFNQLALIIIAGIISVITGDTFYFMGLKKLGVSRTQSISSSYPFYSMLLAAMFLNEELSFTIAIGTPLIVVGIILVSLSKNERNDTNPNGTVKRSGVISPIVAAVFWSIGLITFKIVLNYGNIDPIFLTFISRIAILPFLFFAVVATGESNQLRKLAKNDIIILAIAGMLGIGLGTIFLFVSLALLDASIAIPLSSISPFLSLMLASLYAGEKMRPKIVIGTSLIVTGIILLTFYA